MIPQKEEVGTMWHKLISNLLYPKSNRNQYILQVPTEVFLVLLFSRFLFINYKIIYQEEGRKWKIIPITIKNILLTTTCHKHLSHIHSQSATQILFLKTDYLFSSSYCHDTTAARIQNYICLKSSLNCIK